MRLIQDLALEQRQQLIMTPRLQQAIKLLQLSTLELHQSLQQEIMVNPLLEISANGEECEEEKDSDSEKRLELEWEEYFANSSYSYQSSVDRPKSERTFEDYVSRPANFQEHLLSQLRLLVSREEEMLVGEYIVGNLDDHGFLPLLPVEIARDLMLDLPLVEDVLTMVQSLDPLGVGTADFQSCLLLQLDCLNMDTGLAQEIIQNYFDDLKGHRIRELSRSLQISREKVQQALDLITTLNPRPASGFEEEGGVRYLEPDLVVKEIDGQFYIICNDQGPNLRISPYYRKLMKGVENKKARKYLKDRLDSALWLIRAIEQRRMTVYRTMEAIVDLQKPFFRQGIKHLYPLTMQEVADRIGVHESTVSRATTNKYVQTVHGLFEMKFFFSSGIHMQGRYLAATSVRLMIRDLIKGEESSNPLSDKELSELLGEKGIHLSRRTVAKYRQQLGIPSSSRRRRYD